MKIAICIRGICYDKNYKRHLESDGYIIDFKIAGESIKKNVIEELRKENDVDIFLLTYKSGDDKIDKEVVEFYQPISITYNNQYSMDEFRFNNNVYQTQSRFMLQGIDEVLKNEKLGDFKYDFIFIFRFDLYFRRKITDLKLDCNKVCIGTQRDDLLQIIPRSRLEDFRHIINWIYETGTSTHELEDTMKRNKIDVYVTRNNNEKLKDAYYITDKGEKQLKIDLEFMKDN